MRPIPQAFQRFLFTLTISGLIAVSGIPVVEATDLDLSDARAFTNPDENTITIQNLVYGGVSYSGDVTLFADGTWQASNVIENSTPVDLTGQYKTNVILFADHISLTSFGSTLDNIYEFSARVRPNVIAFTEPPGRVAEQAPVQVLQMWDLLYAEDPNAVVFYNNEAGEGEAVAIRMFEPSFNDDYTEMTFKGVLLNPADDFETLELSNVSIMIDPTVWQWIKMGLWCGGAVIADIVAVVGDIASLAAMIGSAGLGIEPGVAIMAFLTGTGITVSAECANAISELTK
jgi:hypothetical protein